MRLYYLLLVFSFQLQAVEWQQVKNKRGITVYQQKLKSGLIKLKAVTVTDSCIDAFQHLLLDTHNAPKWLTNVSKVTLLETPSDYEHIVYTQLNAPWPIKNRDMVTYSRSIWVSDKQLQIGIQNIADIYPKKKGYIRIENIAASWIVTQKSESKLYIEYQAIADPAGKIPVWLGNTVAKNNVYKTFKNLRERLPNGICNKLNTKH